MIRNLKWIILFFLTQLICFSTTSVFADGVLLVRSKSSNRWEVQKINHQFAAINYADGKEDLILSIALPQDNDIETAAWIFPIPSSPEKITTDILKSHPSFSGKEVSVEDLWGSAMRLMRASQIYPLPVEEFFPQIGSSSRDERSSGLSPENAASWGVQTEVVGAQNPIPFFFQLANYSINLPGSVKEALDGYFGKDFSFLLFVIPDPKKFQGQAAPTSTGNVSNPTVPLIVSVSFPTSQMYFPAKLDSVSTPEQIPMSVYVLGFVQPFAQSLLRPHIQVHYFEDGTATVDAGQTDIFNGKHQLQNLEYTLVEINAPGAELKDDLWLDITPPSTIQYQQWLKKNSLFWQIPVFLVFSVLLSVISAGLTFGWNNIKKFRFALLGFWNIFSIMALAIAVQKLKIAERYVLKPPSRWRKYSKRRAQRYVIIFSILLVVVSIGLEILGRDSRSSVEDVFETLSQVIRNLKSV